MVMNKPSDRRPRDLNQLGKLMVDIASGEVKDTVSAKKKAPASRKGHPGGVAGGKARASKLTQAEKSEIARTAAQARWKKS